MYRHQGAQGTPMRGQQDVHGHGMKPPKAPERPLVPFMRFSRKMWPVVRQENPDKPLWDIGKVVGSMWREISDAERSLYQQEYEAEKVEYEKSMRHYQNSPSYQQYVTSKSSSRPSRVSAPIGGGGGGGGGHRRGGPQSEAVNSTGIIIQPVDDEDPYELTAKKLAAIRFERNNRLMSELFTGAYLPDTRSIVPQFRIEQLRKQAQSLTAHQNKLNDELKNLEETFNHRKRKIEESADQFTSELQRVHEKKPQMGEETYNSSVAKWEEVLLHGYEAYKKRADELKARLEAEKAEAPVLYSLTCPTPEAQVPPPASFTVTEEKEVAAEGDKGRPPTAAEAQPMEEENAQPQ